MHPDDIEKMALQDGKLSPEALEAKFAALRAMNCRMLECIGYAKYNQGCSLREAGDMVINSPTWADQKDGFLQHQEEMHQEFLGFALEDAKTIEMVVTPEGTSYRIIK